MESKEPFDSIQQVVELGRQNSMPSPQHLTTTTTGAEWPTVPLGGTSRVDQVMSPKDTIGGRQGQQEGLLQSARLFGNESTAEAIWYDIAEEDVSFEAQHVYGDLISQLQVPYDRELPMQEMEGDANRDAGSPMTPGLMAPMTPADMTRTMEVRFVMVEALRRVENEFGKIKERDDQREIRIRGLTVRINK